MYGILKKNHLNPKYNIKIPLKLAMKMLHKYTIISIIFSSILGHNLYNLNLGNYFIYNDYLGGEGRGDL